MCIDGVNSFVLLKEEINRTTACAHYCLNWPLGVGAAVELNWMELNQRAGAGISDNGSQVSSFWHAHSHRAVSHSEVAALGAVAPKDAVAIEVVIIVLPWRRCVPNSTLTRECSSVNHLCAIAALLHSSDIFHASPASNNHYVLMSELLRWQLGNKSTQPSVIEYACLSYPLCCDIPLRLQLSED